MRGTNLVGYLTGLVLLGLMFLGASPGTVNAATPADGEAFKKAVRDALKKTADGEANCKEEQKMINDAFKEFQKKQKEDPNEIMGQVFINGIVPIVVGAEPGATALLTFQFVDVTTGLPASGPPVASVVYEVDTTHGLVQDFMTIGVSTDAASLFSMPWSIPDVEAIIQARPLDAAGNAIAIPGDNGARVEIGTAVSICPVPEPSSLVMLGTGVLIGLGSLVWRRRWATIGVPGRVRPRGRNMRGE